MPKLLQLIVCLLITCGSLTGYAQTDRYLHFDGLDDFAEVPNATQYFTGATGVSITGWFCSDGQSYGQGYFGFRGPGSGDGQMYVIELNAGILECRYISTGGFFEFVSPTATTQAMQWQHVAWTFDGSSTSLYINGVFVGDEPSNGSFTSTDRSFGIGKSIEDGFNFVFGGRIDEVNVWSKGLSQAEIQAIMANELVGDEANLELYYKMNQGVPGGNNTGITELVSEVGAGTRNAELMNFLLNGATSNFNISDLDPGFTVSDYCAGAANEATITGLAGGTFTFNTAPGDGATIDPSTGSITDGVAGSSYDIRYTTPGDCAAHEIQTLTVLGTNDPAFTATDFCFGQANQATGIASTGGTFTLDPTPLDGATIDPSTAEISNGVIGSTYTIRYTTAGGSCSTSSTQDVTVLGAPTISNLQEQCAADELTYTVSFDITGGDPGSYMVSGAGTITGNSFTSAPINSGAPYDFIVSDAYTCDTDQVTGLLTCFCIATATLQESNHTICAGSSQALLIDLTGDPSWSVTYSIDGIIQAPVSSAITPLQIDASDAGVYELISVSDDNCTQVCGPEQATISHYPPLSAVIADDLNNCIGDTTDIWAIASGGMGAPYTYTWDSNGLESSLAGEASYILDDFSNVTLTVNEGCNYNQDFSIPVTIHPLPPISLIGANTRCGAGVIELVNLIPGEFLNSTFTWELDSITSNAFAIVSQYLDIGTYDLGVSMTSPEGCTSTALFEDYVEVYLPAQADFTFAPQVITTVENSVSFSNLSQDADAYFWSFGEQGSSTDVEPTHEFPQQQGRYPICLIAESTNGCRDSICQSVLVENDLLVFIPNSFTPNNDGINDQFYPILEGIDESDYLFSIYDRDGSILFETNDAREKWNGNHSKSSDYYAPDAIYTWRLIVKELETSTKNEYTGTVLVVR